MSFSPVADQGKVMGEFELIRKFFQREQAENPAPGVIQGIGDDCAILAVPTAQHLAISVDTLVEGVHFPVGADPELLAERALRTNLSDLAASGASPLWFTLALTLPTVEEDWLRLFSRGLFAAANEYGCALVGGDTTKGPLTVTVQIMGSVEPHLALRRDGASAGDFVLVTNTIGDGAAALAAIQERIAPTDEHRAWLQEKFYRPVPRLKESALLRGIASAALDISDGLLADLGHICHASDVGAVIDVASLPFSAAMQSLNDIEQARAWALGGGDDYELCFTVSPDAMPDIALLIARGELQATIVGELVPGAGVVCELDGELYQPAQQGYQHFS